MKAIFTVLFGITSIIGSAQIGPIMDICLVTVDSNSTHNIVVWEKASQISNIPIDSVKIYRTALGGNDSLVGVVHWDSLSVFHDYSANPNLRWHRYRISGVDTLGIEGPMSIPHQTIHFSVLDNGSGNLHLVWTPYFGANINFYKCWSDSAGSLPGWQWVNSTSTNADTAWWDNTTPSDWTNLTYLVDVDWSNQCSATKAQDHNSTRSNRANITPGAVSVFEGLKSVEEFVIYPNPALERCNIIFSSTNWNPKEISITDLNGKVIRKFNPIRSIGQYTLDVDVSSLASGVYQVCIRSNDEYFSRRFVKE